MGSGRTRLVFIPMCIPGRVTKGRGNTVFKSKRLTLKATSWAVKFSLTEQKQSELVSVTDMKGLILLSGSAVTGEVREVRSDPLRERHTSLVHSNASRELVSN